MIYHCKRFGVVGCDGRVSRRCNTLWSKLFDPWDPCVRLLDRWIPPRFVASSERSVRKFTVLRPTPGLVLAGTSNISMFLTFSVHHAVRGHVENFPESSFDEIAAIIPTTVQHAMDAFRAPAKCHLNLSLLGYDETRVRLRAFSCRRNSHIAEQECEDGLTITGALKEEAGEAELFGNKFFELIGGEYTPESVQRAMLSLATEISASRPESVGVGWFCLPTSR